jgi:hypothetical protein
MNYHSRFHRAATVGIGAISIGAGSLMINDLGEGAIAWAFLYMGLGVLAALTPLLYFAHHRAQTCPLYKPVYQAIWIVIGPGMLLSCLAFPALMEAFDTPLGRTLVLLSLLLLVFQIQLTHVNFVKTWNDNSVRVLEQTYNPKLSVINLDNVSRLLKLATGFHFSSLPVPLQATIFVSIPLAAIASLYFQEELPEIGAWLWGTLWFAAFITLVQAVYFALAIATKLREIEIKSGIRLGYMTHQETVHMRARERKRKKK